MTLKVYYGPSQWYHLVNGRVAQWRKYHYLKTWLIVFAGPFLLQWMPEIAGTEKLSEFLTLLISVIKFNAAYLDEDIVSGFVM